MGYAPQQRTRRIAQLAGLVAGGALAFSACTGTADTDNPPPPSPAEQESPVQAPPPGPSPSAPAPAPVDNCGLDPADMDHKTKVECGLEAPAPNSDTRESSDPNHCDDPSYWNSQQAGDPSAYVEACGEWPSWLSEQDPGSNEEAPSEYQQYQEETGYPYEYEEYDNLPGYQQCGTACGQDPTSGETQQEWGCQEGYIPQEQC